MAHRTARLLALCIATLATGCAGVRPLERLPDGDSLSIVVVAPSDGAPVKIRNRSVGQGMATGAPTGGVIGGLAGLSCGPLAFLCVPVFAGVGAVTGTAGGAAIGAAGALPPAKVARLRERLDGWRQSHDIVEELRTNVAERAGRRWNLNAPAPNWELRIEWQQFELTSTHSELIGLTARAQASLRRLTDGASPPVAVALKPIVYTAAPADIDIWLDDRSDFLDTVLANCNQQIAARVVSEISRHSAPDASPAPVEPASPTAPVAPVAPAASAP